MRRIRCPASTIGRWRSQPLTVALLAAAAAARRTTSPAAAAASAPAVDGPERSRASAAPWRRAPPQRLRHYTGPGDHDQYAIWGDTTEIDNQQKIVDAFQALNPTITVKVTVADWDCYWEKLQTGPRRRHAPDVFVMDGPLFADYQTRDQLLDLSPFIARDGFDMGQLADQAVKDFTGAMAHQSACPAT